MDKRIERSKISTLPFWFKSALLFAEPHPDKRIERSKILTLLSPLRSPPWVVVGPGGGSGPGGPGGPGGSGGEVDSGVGVGSGVGVDVGSGVGVGVGAGVGVGKGKGGVVTVTGVDLADSLGTAS